MTDKKGVELEARELLAAELSMPVQSETEMSLSDVDQVFTEDALRAIEEALSRPTVGAVDRTRYCNCEVPVERQGHCKKCYGKLRPIGAAEASEEVVEMLAEPIYEAMSWAARHAENKQPPQWVPQGNSLAQSEARKTARSLLATLPKVEASAEGQELLARLRIFAARYSEMSILANDFEAYLARISSPVPTISDEVVEAGDASPYEKALFEAALNLSAPLPSQTGYDQRTVEASEVVRLREALESIRGQARQAEIYYDRLGAGRWFIEIADTVDAALSNRERSLTQPSVPTPPVNHEAANRRQQENPLCGL